MELEELVSGPYLLESDFIPNLSGYRCDIESMDPFTINSYFWIEEDHSEYVKLNLKVGRYISIELGDYVCRVCNDVVDSLEKGFCQDCVADQEELLTRFSCMFDKEDSRLNIVGSCTKEDLACSFPGNKKYCHSKYIFYIGRIGNLFKSGISRKNRMGSYKSRLVEQGLQEAMVIRSFPSLPDVLEFERYAFSLGISQGLHFDEKIKALQDPMDEKTPTIADLWPEEYWAAIDLPEEVEYYTLYDHYHLSNDAEILVGDLIEGRIEHIQGPILILSQNDSVKAVNLRNLVYRELLELSVGI